MITVIIQARMASTRLPGKALLPFGGGTVLSYLINRVKLSKYTDQIIVATTTRSDDDIIEILAREENCLLYRGNAENVLDRFYHAALSFHATTIVRVTADDPFKCPEVIDSAIKLYLEKDFDYVSNTIKPTYPEGIDVEVFSFDCLQKALKNARHQRHFEHVTSYVYENSDDFQIGALQASENLSQWRLTIDYLDDYETLSALATNVLPNITYAELVNIIKQNEITNIMHPKTIRNEAYNDQRD